MTLGGAQHFDANNFIQVQLTPARLNTQAMHHATIGPPNQKDRNTSYNLVTSIPGRKFTDIYIYTYNYTYMNIYYY